MKKGLILLLVIVLFLPMLLVYPYPVKAEDSDTIVLYSNVKIVVLRDGAVNLLIAIVVPDSPLADIYRRTFGVSEVNTGEEMQIPYEVKLKPKLELDGEVLDGSISSDAAITVRKDFYEAISRDFECSLGLKINIIDSKIVPRSSSGECKIYLNATGFPKIVSVNSSNPLDSWKINFGPPDSTAYASHIMTQMAFIRLLLEQIDGEQKYKSFTNIEINLPEDAELLNGNWLNGRRWSVYLDCGARMDAILSVSDKVLLVNETFVVVENEISSFGGNSEEEFQNYKKFEISYTLPHSTDILSKNKVCESSANSDFAWSWTIPLFDTSSKKTIKEGPFTATLTFNFKLELSGHVGWEPDFPIPWLNPLRNFEAWIKPQAELEILINASISESLNIKPLDNVQILKCEWPLTFWTPLPVYVNVVFKTTANLEVSVEGNLTINTGVKTFGWLKAGVEWNSEVGWQSIWDYEMQADYISPEVKIEITAELRPSITPRIEVLFYNLAGPYLEFVFYASLKAHLNITDGVSPVLELKIGLEINGGITLWDFLENFGLEDWKWPLAKLVFWYFKWQPNRHDLAITYIELPKKFAYQGEVIQIDVTVENQGDFHEESTVSLYYDEHLIDEKQIAIDRKELKVVTFTWNTEGVLPGKYTIKAEVSEVGNEEDKADNIFILHEAIEISQVDFYITIQSNQSWFSPGQQAEFKVNVVNRRTEETIFWLGVSIKDPKNEYEKYQSLISFTPSHATLKPDETISFRVTFDIPVKAIAGAYEVAVNCWKDPTFSELYIDNIEWQFIFYVHKYSFRILSPTSSNPAIAGDPSDPNAILVTLQWVPNYMLNFSYMQDPQFLVEIGGRQAELLPIDQFMQPFGIYTLWVLPPIQPQEGLYNLSVRVIFDNLIDSLVETNSVKYVTAPSPEPIQKGLEWLRTRQKPDGSWYGSVGITSLCVLAFLNAGYNETDITVSKAINYILSKVKPDGRIYTSYPTYETSLAILALVATHNDTYKDVIENAKNWLVNSQWDENCIWGRVNKDHWYYGGFGYGSGQRPDLSNTQFALLALDAAGLPKNNSLWTKVQVFLHRCQNVNFSITLNIEGSNYTVLPYNHYGGYDGGFIYRPGTSLAGDQRSYGSMTGAGIWSLLLSGVPRSDPRVVAAINWVKNHYTWDGNPGMPEPSSLQYYYYLSMSKALTMYGGRLIDDRDWYQEMYNKIVSLQKPEGYWINPNRRGWENVPELVTAYSILSLQTRTVAPPVQRLSYITFILRSNCHIRIIDPEGRVVGYNYTTCLGENYVPTAVYSGPFFEPQYVVIVNPEAGTYKLELVGISEGPYELIIQGNYGEEITDKFTYKGWIRPAEIHGTDVTVTAIVGPVDIYASPPKFQTVIDSTPPITTLEISDPKYVDVTGEIYVTPTTPFTLIASDDPNGTGVASTLYRIYNSTYDSDWIIYNASFRLAPLADGTYTIEYYSKDKAGNTETIHTLNVTLFSWNYVFKDSYGRRTILKINLVHKFFQFITPDRDYNIRKATYMREYGRANKIQYYDEKLRLITLAVNTQLDLCIVAAWDQQTGKHYLLIDKAGIEYEYVGASLKNFPFLKANYKIQTCPK